MDQTSSGDIIRARGDTSDAWDFGDVLARLEAATGQPRSYWITHSRRYAFRVLEHATRYSMAGGAFAFAEEGSDPEYIKASFDFNAAVELIRERAANGRG